MKKNIKCFYWIFLLCFVLNSCKNEVVVVKYEGYALISNIRHGDRKQVEIVQLNNYDRAISLSSYIKKIDTLTKIQTFLSVENLSYYKILDKNNYKMVCNVNLENFDLVYINYEITNIDEHWMKTEYEELNLFELNKFVKDYVFTDWDNKNKLNIKKLKYFSACKIKK